jgi:hypothetical protein
MRTLYIIGNGFDVYHGLKTRYQAFAYYLQDYHSDIYDLLIENYGLKDLDRDDPHDMYDELWSQFEATLADFDFETVFEDHAHLAANPASPEFSDGDWYTWEVAMEAIVDSLTKHLFGAFKEFILQVAFPDHIDDLKLNLDPTAKYLSFNYTDTLEHYYDVPEENITYIHNKAKTPDAILVLGHGIDPDSFVEPEPQRPAGATEEELEYWHQQQADNWELSADRAKDEILTYFSQSHKDTDDVIKKNQAFFDGLADIKHIIVLGHSLAPVDQPYLKKILIANDYKAVWSVSFYKDEEIDEHKASLTGLGLAEANLNFFRMTDLRL